GVAHFQPEFGDNLRVRLVADVDDLRITESRRPPVTRGRPTARAARTAGLVRADDVRVPLNLHGDHGLGCPLVRPEELADDSYLRIGETKLIVADVHAHPPVRDTAECPCLPPVPPRPIGPPGLEARRVEF